MEREEAGFVHLHVHTEYSLRQAACRLDELVQLVHSWGMSSLAITDKEAIHGAVRFSKLAKQSGIRPIIGCEAGVEPGASLILLAVNNRGLERIVSHLNRVPANRHTYENFGRLSGGDIIALSGGRSGIIYRLLAEGKTELAKAKALEYAMTFGEGNFYLEVQHHGAVDIPLMKLTERLSDETGIPLVATHDVHYIHREDEKLLNLLRKEQSASEGGDLSFPGGSLYLPSPQEMAEKFKHLPEALKNTVKIANRCRATFETGETKFPRFPVPATFGTVENYLIHLCNAAMTEQSGLPYLAESQLQRMKERLTGELNIITSRGLASYFLIVWDIVRFARQREISVGPGRGSAAGCLVAYLLGITQVNPIVHGLSFERFLSEDRTGLPDIDLDVCQLRRQEILEYVIDTYGEDKVAHIGVLNTFGTRGAVREAGKFLNLPQQHVNVMAKLLPALSGRGGIQHCLQTLPEFQRMPIGSEPYRSLFETAKSLEGLPRNQGTHPSGILIGPVDLSRIVPIQYRPGGVRLTAFTKEDVQALGLLKIDLLGSRILTVIEDTIQTIRRNGGDIELGKIQFDDPGTFRMLSEGDTLGCFQLESMGIRSLLRRMKPKHIEDLVALLALYRPGAGDADITGTFLRRRLGREKAEVPLPEMEPILASTYGLVLYQEQVMEIAHTVAGITMGEADRLMRVLIRKNAEDLSRQRRRFIDGAMQRGITAEAAAAVFRFLTRFIGYSFPKAHSVPYAYLSYWTVFLKKHYPKEYMASLLSLPGGYYEQKAYLREAVRLGIPLLRPDINSSGFGFCSEEYGIRVGLDAVKGCGPEAVASLVRSRRKDGDFMSLADFLDRMKDSRVGMQILRGWIASGACDCFGLSRRYMLNILGERDFGTVRNVSVQSYTAETEDDRIMEKRALGFPLHSAPSPRWIQFTDRYNIVNITSLACSARRSRVRICGIVVYSRRSKSADGNYFLSLVVQDLTGMVEVVLYPDIYKMCLYELNPNGMMIEGIVKSDDGTARVIAQRIKALSSA